MPPCAHIQSTPQNLTIDGTSGNDGEKPRRKLVANNAGSNTCNFDASEPNAEPSQIPALLAPYLGARDSNTANFTPAASATFFDPTR